ncbi:UMP kinase [Candidatus Woesearchaeota archaeon]|nr:UMP kinase [Candidatus Woesearchaeota archaeon]
MKIVFSLGGSVIIPDKVDLDYLEKFKKLILKLKKKHKIIIVTGGGKTARNYISALEQEGLDKKTLAYIGIFTTRLNARLVAALFKLRTVPSTEKQFYNMAKKERLIVTGALGFHPKMTSDGTAAEIASKIRADLFINVTNVNGLYNKDPKIFKNTSLIRNISFKDFYKKAKKIKFRAGQHFVLDEIAAKIIYAKKIKTAIANRSTKNIERIVEEKKFLGTLIA